LALAKLFGASTPDKLNNQVESPSLSSTTSVDFFSSDLVKFSNNDYQSLFLANKTTVSVFYNLVLAKL